MNRWNSVAELITGFDCKTIAEVGVYEGTMTLELLKLVAERLSRYYVIDWWLQHPCSGMYQICEQTDWEDMLARVYQNLDGFSCVRVIRMESLGASKVIDDQSLDLVFIDGSPEYEMIR